MKILIIEDDPKTASYLSKGLVENSYRVDIANNGEEGLFLATELELDLCIVDVMLPKLDGWGVVKGIREHNKTLPIIMLTARDEVDDRVKGLQLGADDYLVKPFAFSELLARINALTRRSTKQAPDVLEIDTLKIDVSKHRATRDGKRLDLSPKEFSLLLLLARHQGELMTRTLIAEKVWDMNFDSNTNVVDVAIRRLRAKVDDPYEIKLIHTVRGVGYVLEDRDE